jgi:hypothetical protein
MDTIRVDGESHQSTNSAILFTEIGAMSRPLHQPSQRIPLFGEKSRISRMKMMTRRLRVPRRMAWLHLCWARKHHLLVKQVVQPL